MIFAVGATSQSADVQVLDDSGLPVTGLVAATFAALTYSLAGPNADVAFPALTDLAAITTAWAAGGIKERGNGVYRVDLPNGMFTTAGQVRMRGEVAGKHVFPPTFDVQASNLGNLLDLLQADQYVDETTTPWNVVLIKKGTGGLGVGTELLRQKLKDTANLNVTGTAQIIGSSVT